MKTVLDLIGEFAELNDAKVKWGGRMPPEVERRWAELKSFYDLLMSHYGVSPRPVTRRFSAKDVLEKVKSRERLRVPMETEIAFEANDDLRTGVAVNLSRGGVFLAAPEILPARSSVTVFIASPDVAHESLLEARGEVVWSTNHGVRESSLPPGMGIHFVGKEASLERYLDALVIDALLRHLSGLDANGLAPDFILKEQIEL